ncbi:MULTISPECIES: glycosyltransferase family 4 protein [Sphingobium]|uniref:Glycosyltransferase n=1 Tax=Sphingobium fuliginis (strain ATCC 27551) TaxID=336203 RepID=A0A292ZD76_SPHSA|nr:MULTISPECIES: glycosyltransferase family 4 protein [Sphingobium]QOT70214.1 glycosyltransferase family 4 protein [Sphingobium fuliginis]GAY20794.1 glycosyltransferase [Sphingobium fuliginis]
MRGGGHLLLSADAVGGVWQYSTDLIRALQPHGYEVTLAVMGPALSEAQRAEAAAIANCHLVETGLELEWLAAEAAPIVQAEARLAEMAGDLRADAVQLHTPALASAGRYPCPAIALLHSCVATWWEAVRGGPMPEDFNWRTALVAAGLRQASRIVAPSMAFAQAARRHYGVLPMAVHNGRFFPVKPQAMQDHVFTAGRLWDEGKNVRVLDEAAARIAVPFRAAGPLEGPQGGAIGLRSLLPLGPLDSMALARHLASRPVFASAALYEPFGLAVLEAALAGCALVLSDIPTFRELWDGAAIFVHPHDARGFTLAIEELLGDGAARGEMGQRAQARAGAYTPAATAAHMAAHYRAVQRKVAA